MHEQEKLIRSAQGASIAFLADRRRFGYDLIGGSESYVRRLATAVAEMGVKCYRFQVAAQAAEQQSEENYWYGQDIRAPGAAYY